MSETFEQLDPNYVICFDYSKDNLTQLITELAAKGLHALTRPGYDEKTVYAYTRVENHDFQTGSQNSRSVQGMEQSGNEVLYRICEPLKFIRSITPIHDFETRKKLDSLSNKLLKQRLGLPSSNDLLSLSHLTKNPREALYFAFLKTYIQWLWPLSIIGLFFRFISTATVTSEFNIPYSLCLLLWSVLFICTWSFKTQKGFSSKLGKVHGSFNYTDKKLSSPTVVLYKKLLFIPVAILFAATLISYQFCCFFIEIFLTQFYQGPLKSILSLTPIVLLSAFVPFFTSFYNKLFVDRLVAWENGPNPIRSKVEKNFVLVFLTSYVPLLITLFFYLPMGYKLTPEWQDRLVKFCQSYHIPVKGTDFVIDLNRYRNQFFFVTVTNHFILLSLEDLLPMAIDKLIPLVRKDKKKEMISNKLKTMIKSNYPNELSIWEKNNYFNTTSYGEFNVDDNYRKMVVQFGYIAIFSTIWPVAPFLCLCFNYVILKVDLWRALTRCKPSSNLCDAEIAENSLTAIDVSADPWNTIMKGLAWLGAIISPSLIAMYRYSDIPGVGLPSILEKKDLWYRYSPVTVSGTTVLLVALASEHLVLLSYLYLKKIFESSTKKFVYGFVPAIESQEPPKINLSEMVKETVQLMSSVSSGSPTSSELSGLDTAGMRELLSQTATTTASKKTEGDDKREVSENHTTANRPICSESNTVNDAKTSINNATSSISKDILPRSNANGGDGKLVGDEGIKRQQDKKTDSPSTSNTMENSLTCSKSNASSADSLSVAGATLPETIPTSKNYHLRYDKDGKPTQSPNATSTSVSPAVDDIASTEKTEKNATSNHLPDAISSKEANTTTDKIRQKKLEVSNPVALDELPKKREITPRPNGQDTTSAVVAAVAANADNAAANASVSGGHSRTSSQIHAVQQFGRDVPTSIKSTKSTKSTPDSSRAPHRTSASVKSKATASSNHHSSSTSGKTTETSKRASLDVTSKEHKPTHKHKKGLLRKLKNKL